MPSDNTTITVSTAESSDFSGCVIMINGKSCPKLSSRPTADRTRVILSIKEFVVLGNVDAVKSFKSCFSCSVIHDALYNLRNFWKFCHDR